MNGNGYLIYVNLVCNEIKLLSIYKGMQKAVIDKITKLLMGSADGRRHHELVKGIERWEKWQFICSNEKSKRGLCLWIGGQ